MSTPASGHGPLVRIASRRVLLPYLWGFLVGCSHAARPTPPKPRTQAVVVVEPSGTDAPVPSVDAGFNVPEPTIDECTALVDVVNTGVDAVSASHELDPASDALRALAATLDSVGLQMRATELSAPVLARYAERYQAMASEVAGAARDLASAADDGDMKAMSTAQKRLVAAVALEDLLVEEINSTCQDVGPGPPDE